MKPGTLLKYYPSRYNSMKESWLGVLLEYHPSSSPNVSWIRILWEDGKVDEVNWGYTDLAKWESEVKSLKEKKKMVPGNYTQSYVKILTPRGIGWVFENWIEVVKIQ